MISQTQLKSIAIEIFLIIALALLSGFVVNFYLSSKGIALFGAWDTSKGVISAKSITDDPVMHDLEITDVHVAKSIFDSRKAVFLDARSLDDYMDGHIKGAVSTPVNRFEDEAESFKKQYPLSTYFVTYCSGRECDDSHKLAQDLLMAGYENVSVFIDGYPGWEAEGFPVEK
ncbi:rhodanese-like domain-containing protein [Thermodesulfobacteriota bacterium]